MSSLGVQAAGEQVVWTQNMPTTATRGNRGMARMNDNDQRAAAVNASKS